MLVGQILWVNWPRLVTVAVVYAVLLALLFGIGERLGRIGFYLIFAVAVTVSVQLVGLYLVFTTLIVPALATHRLRRGRLAVCYALGAAGYAVGLLASAVLDLPSGAVIVWALALFALPVVAWGTRQTAAG